MTLTPDERLLAELTELYGPQEGRSTYNALLARLDAFQNEPKDANPQVSGLLDQRDALLITYPDQVNQPGEPPLVTLESFAAKHLTGRISAIHILPFYPATSDDGFAVVDYQEVDPGLGSWEDVVQLAMHFRLMADAVINHISSKSAWVQGYLAGEERYRDYFIAVPPDADLSKVVRPRTLPLVTDFPTPTGEVPLWTTFSADQVDLNYQNPRVLLDVIDALLLYVRCGAQLIRLDAIAFLWKEFGTTCIHLPQTHACIRVMRAALDRVAPETLLVTETNVPHRENLSYFGDGVHEAQLVYNFALPPLTLHTFLTGNADALTGWAGGLALPSPQTTFLNFLASHDGIGVNPVREILSQSEIDGLVAAVQQRGGLVSSKSTPSGEMPYELNINYFDALSNRQSREREAVQIDRFVAAQAILLALKGMPAIYFHSLFGSRGWPEGVRQTGRARTINRQKLGRAALEAELADPCSQRAQVFPRLAHLLEARRSQPAFSPYGGQEVLRLGRAVFGLVRRTEEGGQPVVCLHNVTDQPQTVALEMERLPSAPRMWKDLVSGQGFVLGKRPNLLLQPYQVMWLA
jgi:glucosylglycerate phosphorylase